jgi:hypothetical protein
VPFDPEPVLAQEHLHFRIAERALLAARQNDDKGSE